MTPWQTRSRPRNNRAAVVQHHRPETEGGFDTDQQLIDSILRAQAPAATLHHRRAAVAELAATLRSCPSSSVRATSRSQRTPSPGRSTSPATDTPGPRPTQESGALRAPRRSSVVAVPRRGWVIDGGSTVTGNPQRISDGRSDLRARSRFSSPRSRIRRSAIDLTFRVERQFIAVPVGGGTTINRRCRSRTAFVAGELVADGR